MKTRKLYTVIGILAIFVLGLAFVGCGDGEDGGDNNSTGPGTTGSGTTPNPVTPVISVHPQGATYKLNAEAETISPLTVTATKSDGGVLSYQWYRNTANSNEGGTAIDGATEASFTPPTDTKGVVYYYVIVTNTLNGKTANATSNTAGIGVGITTVKINSGLTVQSKVYDGTKTATVTGTAELSGVEDGDVVTVIAGTVAFNDKNVGTDKAITFSGWSLGGANASDYMLSAEHENIKGEITAKSVTITGLMAQGKPYDGTTTATVAGTAVISGLISGDTVTATGGTVAFADKNVGTGKTVTFSGWSLTGTDADNYNLSAQPANATAVITAKTVTITGLTVADKIYDGSPSATVSRTAVVSGKVEGDTVTVTSGTIAFANKNVGATVTCSGYTLDGADKDNYTLTQPNFTANITPKSVTITGLSAQDKNYDGTTTATVSGTAVVSGLISGDTVTATGGTAVFADKNVGTGKIVTFSGWYLTGIDAGNYNLSAQPANVTANITVGVEMVQINAGTFTMGSPTTEAYRESNKEGSETQHQVTLTKSFYMGKYEVTQEQYEAVMGSNPSGFQTAVSGESGTPGKLPVEKVNWYDAIVFCNKLSMMEGLSPVYSISDSTDPATWGTVPSAYPILKWDNVIMVSGANGYRLPTEAEWEYSCRAGTTTAFNNGNDDYTDTESVGAVEWYTTNSGDKTHQVGLKTPNAWGLYDMHGNVNELCWDWYGDYASGAQTDPTGAVTGSYRVARGGYWNTSSGLNLRSAYRSYSYPHPRNYNIIGFRLVRSLP